MREEDIKSFEDAFFDALNLFNNQKWYEAHDAFEDIWNTLEGDERQIIQGILQVSVSQFHLSKGNLNGATILLGEGLGRIKNRTNIDLGIDLVSFCQCLDELLRKLQYKEKLTKNDKPYLVRKEQNEF
ncbi:DUF309 domain-containing protein [Prochlorococcus sp. AH-716-O05]|nr:DUF309 domain-containing protein [Prochlorococcus sp. AH-716-O05]